MRACGRPSARPHAAIVSAAIVALAIASAAIASLVLPTAHTLAAPDALVPLPPLATALVPSVLAVARLLVRLDSALFDNGLGCDAAPPLRCCIAVATSASVATALPLPGPRRRQHHQRRLEGQAGPLAAASPSTRQ